MKTSRRFSSQAVSSGRGTAASRVLAEEAAVAISYNGSSHAVVMATPDHLEDLAAGFTLTEGIVSSFDEIESIDVVEGERGVDVQVRLATDATERLEKRRRAMAGPVGCGMCGLESIDAAMREVPAVGDGVRLRPADVAAAVAAMAKAQMLNHATRAVHAAGWFVPGKGLAALREDVGRHNALDKLIGAVAAENTMAAGAVVMSSRLSVELVQKTAVAGCGVLIAVSAPTALAVETAERANITLVAIARGEAFEVFTHPDRIAPGALPHVA